jgi:hypothetical protein
MTQPIDDSSDTFYEAPESNRPGILTVIILLFLLLAMLASLLWPLLQVPIIRQRFQPTPTSPFLQEA